MSSSYTPTFAEKVKFGKKLATATLLLRKIENGKSRNEKENGK